MIVLAALAGLCVLAYLPLLWQPLLEDDWPNIAFARQWQEMAGHPVYRYRMVFWLITYAVDRVSALSPPAFYAVSIALHILATWVVYSLGAWPAVGWRLSALAAGFFAIYEGHQEAVMWYSASAETMMFIFGAGAVMLWGLGRTLPALLLFAAALFSKESAAIFAPMMLLAAPRRWKQWLAVAALAAAYLTLILSGSGNSFRFHDGSFSLAAPFWITWPVSIGRMLWPWGLLAVAALLIARQWPRAASIGAVWMAIGLAPYVFLTYMHRVPSRHTYVASAGLALVVGAAFLAVRDRIRRPFAIAVAILVIAVNTGYLWTRKREQFSERAAPTEALIAAARNAPGPLYVRCFPLARITAEAAVNLSTGKRVVWQAEAGATEFCWKAR